MNILISGATGFVGSRLCELKYDLFGDDDKIILLSSRPVPGEVCVIHNNYTYSVKDFFAAGIDHIDSVIHLGHYLEETHNHTNIVKGNLSSINNTMHLIDNLPSIPQIFVYISSMAVYGTNRIDRIQECSSTNPDTPYGLSKLYTEYLLDEWSKEKNVKLHVLRLSHIYGPKDKRKYTIPIWLQAALQDKPISLFANPSMYRNCLYIDDCCRFIARASKLNEDIKVINTVSSSNPTLYQIALNCKKVSKNNKEVILKESDDKSCGIEFDNAEIRRIYLGNELYSLEKGLKDEFLYYESNWNYE